MRLIMKFPGGEIVAVVSRDNSAGVSQLGGRLRSRAAIEFSARQTGKFHRCFAWLLSSSDIY